jgi:hypothetical protein
LRGIAGMKRWKKFLLLLLVLVLLSQIPFVYRRYQLGRLNEAIISVESQRQTPNPADRLREFRGVAHVHSFLGGHSIGTFQDIIAGANFNKLDFVLMSEHPSGVFNTSEMTLKGEHAGVLFINGNEVTTSSGDRVLLFPGDTLANSDSERSTQAVLSRRRSGAAFVAYPEEFKSWNATGYHGIEVYNVYSNAQKINPVLMFFDGLWSYRSYPDLLFARFYTRPSENLKKWDEEITRQGQKLVGIAGNDSHSNVGISLNDSSGNPLLGLKLDPYERSFRLVRLHVLIEDLRAPNLTNEALLAAISSGNCFIGYDLFGDTSGFRFTAQDTNETRIMGDQITLEGEVLLTVTVPVVGRIMLLKDGVTVKDHSGISKLEFAAKEKGAYRVEVYLPQLPRPAGDQPWIISNPIYVK